MSDDQPIREFRPVVVPLQYLVWAPLLAAFISLFPGVFAFVISNIIRGALGRFSSPVVIYGLVAYLLSFVVAMGILYLKVFIEPGRTTYAIYPDRLEYAEGLLNRERRTALFDQVIDVRLTEGLLQQTKGVGSIKLTTQQLVSSGDGKLSNRRVVLHNVPEPQAAYELLKSLAKDNTASPRPTE